MIGIHLSKLYSYTDQHSNINFSFIEYYITLSYHQNDTRQVYYENEEIIVLIDGWIFNSPSYSSQAEFVKEIYLSYRENILSHVDGQFNILICDKKSKTILLFNDIYSFRKEFITETFEVISSDFEFAYKHLRSISFNYIHIYKNLNYPRFLNINESFIQEINIIPPAAAINILNKSIQTSNIEEILQPYSAQIEENSLQNITSFNDQVSENIQSVHKESKILLGLSGGLDSRYLLELMSKKKLHVETLTYGNENSDEVCLARQVAQKVGTIHHEVDLSAIDFIESSKKYIGQTGGLDIFPQSHINNVFRDLNISSDNYVLDSGFALDAFLGGSQIGLISGGRGTGLSSYSFDFSENDIYSSGLRIFSSLAIRQAALREFIEDRYSMYSYSNYALMKRLSQQKIKGNRFYIQLLREAISESRKIPVHQTMFDIDLATDQWTKAALIQKQKEEFVEEYNLSHEEKINLNRYYSDFSQWIKFDTHWNELIECCIRIEEKTPNLKLHQSLKELIACRYQKKQFKQREIIRLMSTYMFIETYAKN